MRLHDVSKSASNSEVPILSEEQLKKLQKLLLSILEDIDYICDKYNLKYILIGGSAIGAMRHKGFIPWDDDIDIAITRKDYNELVKIIRTEYSNKYSIFDANDDKNYGRIIPKIRLKGTTYRTILEPDLEDCGIRIDIFLIENVFNNFLLRNIQGIGCLFFGFALSCRRLYSHKNEFKNIVSGVSFKIKKFLGFIFSFASLETWARWTNKWYSICKKDDSKYVSVPTDGAHFFGELTNRTNLCDRKEIIFEGKKRYVPSSVDSYLTRIYGNYMKIPPIEKQLRSKYLEYNLGKYE